VGEQGAGLKRGTGARTWPENMRSWARPQREIMGERLETANRWGRRDRERERERAGARETTSTARPHGAARERGKRVRSGWRRQEGPACQTQGTRGRGRAGWAKWAGLGFNGLFYFPGISIAFSIYFL
jgi:hypothetical protein